MGLPREREELTLKTCLPLEDLHRVTLGKRTLLAAWQILPTGNVSVSKT